MKLLYIQLRELLKSEGWEAPELKFPVTIWGSSITSPLEPTCITLYITAPEK